MTRFVGRAGECAALERYAGQARSGQPRVVIVEGDAGGGKSALLAHFAAGVADARTLRASGDAAEQFLAYGVLGQFMAAVQDLGLPAGAGVPDGADPLLAGAQLVSLLGTLQQPGRLLVLIADDLHWADRPSAQALLFALRRLRHDRVLVLLSARPGALGRLGESWARFASGDHRVARLRLEGFSADELLQLGRVLGAGDLTPRAIRNLIGHSGGNPLYCRILIEELGGTGLDRAHQDVQIPQALAGLILPRVAALTPAARNLVNAAAVLGHRCSLALASRLSATEDSLPAALGESVHAGLLIEETGVTGRRVAFPHALIHRVVYGGLSPSTRHALHTRAAEAVGGEQALAHRFAIATSPDQSLADDLEEAGRAALETGRADQAATWFAQASGLSTRSDQRDRRLLDAMEILVGCGDAAGAQALLPEMMSAAPCSKRTALLGRLDLLRGRIAPAEAHLLDAWQRRDPGQEPLAAMVASQLAQQYLVSGRVGEAVGWARRYVASAGNDEVENARAHGLLAFVLTAGGRSAEGLACLGFLPSAPAEMPLALTDALALRGISRLFAEELPGAVADLCTAAARLRAGVPLLFGCQTLSYLADAAYRLGLWDEAVIYGELAVSLAHDTEAGWALGFAHGAAALVPAARGQWAVAEAHARAARQAALSQGAAAAIVAAATARAVLGDARQDPAEVVLAAQMVRATRKASAFSLPAHFEWPALEVDAYISLGRLDEAHAALADMEKSLPCAPRDSAKVETARLRGSLATARGDIDEAARSFALAWRYAGDAKRPLHLARLEIDDSRRLRRAGQRRAAIARLRSARQRLTALGARPYVDICDRELAACGVAAPAGGPPGALGLTPAELAVAWLVAAGHTNREAAAELYVSVKTIEFHLSHIYAKLGIRTRAALSERMAMPRVLPIRTSSRPPSGPPRAATLVPLHFRMKTGARSQARYRLRDQCPGFRKVRGVFAYGQLWRGQLDDLAAGAGEYGGEAGREPLGRVRFLEGRRGFIAEAGDRHDRVAAPGRQAIAEFVPQRGRWRGGHLELNGGQAMRVGPVTDLGDASDLVHRPVTEAGRQRGDVGVGQE